jgi:Protein kinase domain
MSGNDTPADCSGMSTREKVPQEDRDRPVSPDVLPDAATTPAPGRSPLVSDGSGPLPRELGPYRLLSKIHQGGMGIVYEALHIRLGKRVALKTIRLDRVCDAHFMTRFHREIAALGPIAHPNIVRATDAGEADGCPFLVMDLVEGLDLNALVQRSGPPAVPDACEVARQTALALAHVESHGLVHRDLKPANLMLTFGGEVKLLDLGLALFHPKMELDDQLSGVGIVLGTGDFMAPEQYRDAHGVDIRADLYSLGCTLYYLLTGRAPFAGQEYPTLHAKFQAHAEKAPPPICNLRSDVPADLAALLDRLLAKDPADRFAHPDTVAAALEPFTAGADLSRWLAEAGGNSRGMTVAYPRAICDPAVRDRVSVPAAPRPTQNSRRLVVRMMAGVLLLVLAGGIVAILPRPNAPSTPSTPGRPAIVWPADYPAELRDRSWFRPSELLARRPDPAQWHDPAGVRVRRATPEPSKELLYQPVWCRRLLGNGKYTPLDSELQLTSGPGKHPGEFTLVALDDDLQRRWFELEVELPEYNNDIFNNPRGIFFGWQKHEPGKARAYFVSLDLRRDPRQGVLHGRLTVGPAVLPLDAAEDLVPLGPYQGTLPSLRVLTESARTHRIRVRALPGRVRVQLNSEDAIDFKPPFDPRGPLGLWVQGGRSRFRRVLITALPES